MRWTEEQLADHLRRRGIPAASEPADTSAPPFLPPANQAGAFALGRLPVGTMNKTEKSYAAHLDGRRSDGALLWWKFEAVKLRLADNTFYTPDFMVLPASMLVELHEVKGYWQDDARVKIKVAAAIYPFKFVAIKKVSAGWEREEFS